MDYWNMGVVWKWHIQLYCEFYAFSWGRMYGTYHNRRIVELSVNLMELFFLDPDLHRYDIFI